MKYLLLIPLLLTGLSVHSANDVSHLDELIYHQRAGLDSARGAREKSTDKETKKLFDDMISSHEKELKRLSEMRSKMKPESGDESVTNISGDFQKELSRLESEMKTMFARYQSRFQAMGPQASSFPEVEVKENKNGYVVRAEIPGINKEDIKVTMTGNHLVISGRHEEQLRQEEKGASRLESSSAEFVRTVPFEKKVDPASMKVNFKKDEVEITLNKARI